MRDRDKTKDELTTRLRKRFFGAPNQESPYENAPGIDNGPTEQLANYIQIVDALPVALVVLQGGLIRFQNRGWVDITGYDFGSSMLCTPVEGLVHFDDRETAQEIDRWRRRSATSPQRYELRIVCRDHKVKWIEMLTGTITWNTEPAELIIGSDITDHKLTKMASRFNEDKFRKAFQCVPNAMMISRVDDGRILDVNERFLSLTGYSRDEVLSITTVNLNLWKDLLEREQLVAILRDKKKVRDMRVSLRAKTGQFSDCLFSAETILIDDELYMLSVVQDVSELKKAHQSLLKTIKQYKAIFENTSVGIYICDQEGFFQFVNPALLNTLGYTQEDIVKLTYLDVTHPDDRDILKLNQEALLGRNINVFKIENRFVGKDQTVIWADLSVSGIRANDGKIMQVVGTIRDVTLHKELARNISQNERKYRLLIDNAPIGILLSDTQGQILEANHACLEVLGSPGREATKSINMLTFAPLQEAGVSGALIKCLSENRVVTHNTPYTTKWGKNVYLRMIFAPMLDELGNVEGCQAVIEDISDRIEAEKRLQQNEERHRIVADFTYDLEYWIDETGTLVYISPSCERITGYPPKSFLDDPYLFSSLIHPEDIGLVKEHFTVFRDGCLSDEGFLEYRIVNRKGEIRWLEHICRAVVDASGTFLGRRGSERDITDRKIAEEEKEKMRLQLLQAQKMEAVGALAGGIAHDFNNILQVVSGYSDLLLMDNELGDAESESIRKIQTSARRGADLVQGLMTFSRKGDSKLSPLHLNHEVTRTKNLLERTLPKMISIELDMEENVSLVNADPVQIEQIVMNLSINARDAMPPEGGKLTIGTKNVTLDDEFCRLHPGTKPGPHVLLSVSDSGCGMTQETAQHIFEPFFTTKEPEKGTGLGLSIVFGIVKQHDGHINCHSVPGQGTTFDIYFPAIKTTMVENPDSNDSVTVIGGSETILLVDDEESVSRISSTILEREGYRVLTANRARDAIELYRRRKDEIALIVLDLMMPEMGGIQCMRELVKINPEVKVIISSGMVSEKSEQAIELGAKRFVEKPHGMKKLRQVVRQVLDGD